MQRLKKILKWTGVVLVGLAAILLIANAIFVWTTDARLNRQLAEIKAAGDPITLADLARKPIPPETNAATYLRQAQADVRAIQDEMEKWNAAEKVADFWDCFGDKPMPEKMHKAMKAIYAAHPKVIGLLRQAADCPDYDPQLDYTLPPDQFLESTMALAQDLRGDARVLRYRSRLLEIEGNRDEAMHMAMLNLRLGQHFERTPMIIGHLIGLVARGMAIADANRAMQAGPISQATRLALDAELARQEPMAGFVAALKSERAFVLDNFPTAVPARNFWLVARGLWNMQESACLDLFPTLLANASGSCTYRKSSQVIHRSNSQLAALLYPAIDAAFTAATRIQAEIRCLRVLNALQTHASSGSNETPKITELGLPANATTDPFNGQPLHIKKLPQGWLVYSVGRDLQDNGGKIGDSVTDVGVGPPPTAKADEPTKK